ncbi:hypothetical protein AMATHDRAFT_49593 [Amanita thiersii Skay4041]|uniref:Uncharacterized protein n=1 Tax=Amanita thiersii Skay4041 TaxID=703135 RepID=A0A2A9NKW8_9AGAR|nr:hypothetical protein AMATHDRAFT_49593 [Amanita thiersii Skay4041]
MSRINAVTNGSTKLLNQVWDFNAFKQVTRYSLTKAATTTENYTTRMTLAPRGYFRKAKFSYDSSGNFLKHNNFSFVNDGWRLTTIKNLVRSVAYTFREGSRYDDLCSGIVTQESHTSYLTHEHRLASLSTTSSRQEVCYHHYDNLWNDREQLGGWNYWQSGNWLNGVGDSTLLGVYGGTGLSVAARVSANVTKGLRYVIHPAGL